MTRPSTQLVSTHLPLAKNQVLVFNRRPAEIHCLAGWVWVTDGLGGERVIQSGQKEVLLTKGKICIQALAPSVVCVAPDACIEAAEQE